MKVTEKANQLPNSAENPTREEKEMKPVFCWHVRDHGRLCRNLSEGYCDLHPQPRADKFYKRFELKPRVRVRFCIAQLKDKDGGSHRCLIVAHGTIAGWPKLLPNPELPEFPMGVDIKDISVLDDPFHNPEHCLCCQKAPPKGSHRLDGAAPCAAKPKTC